MRYVHFGEGEYEQTEAAIRSLLAEAGAANLGDPRPRRTPRAPTRRCERPETYLGAERAQGWVEGPEEGEHEYDEVAADELGLNEFAFGGAWNVDAESARALADASTSLRFRARRVFLVLGSDDAVPRRLRIELDGEPISDADAGDDVSDGYRDRHRAAPLSPRRPSRGRGAHAATRLRPRHNGLRIQLRLIGVGRPFASAADVTLRSDKRLRTDGR